MNVNGSWRAGQRLSLHHKYSNQTKPQPKRETTGFTTKARRTRKFGIILTSELRALRVLRGATDFACLLRALDAKRVNDSGDALGVLLDKLFVLVTAQKNR